MNNEMPIIYKYQDYKEYLVDMVNYIKHSNKAENITTISKSIGITNSYLSMLLSGKRDLSRALISKISEEFNLSKQESKFFELMVYYNIETDDREKSKYYEKIKKFKKFKEFNQVDASLHDYMSSWLNVTLREMTALNDFREDPAWIQSKLKYRVSTADIKNSLKFLLAEEIIKKENGLFQRPDFSLTCTDKVYSNALTKFHREFLELAGDSIAVSHRDERQLVGHCVAFDEENFNEAQKILNEALEKIKNLKNKTVEKEAVYFMELALFPLTKTK